jgi:hypothetical protein
VENEENSKAKKKKIEPAREERSKINCKPTYIERNLNIILLTTVLVLLY